MAATSSKLNRYVVLITCNSLSMGFILSVKTIRPPKTQWRRKYFLPLYKKRGRSKQKGVARAGKAAQSPLAVFGR